MEDGKREHVTNATVLLCAASRAALESVERLQEGKVRDAAQQYRHAAHAFEAVYSHLLELAELEGVKLGSF